VITVPVDLDIPGPFHAEALLVFFGRHAVPGIESYRDVEVATGRRIDYARTLRLPAGPAVLELSYAAGALAAKLQLSDADDLDEGRRRLEHLCDLATDIGPVEDHLAGDDELRPLVAASPGLRVPGVVDAHEHLLRTMIGQQISLAGAANCAGKLVARFGDSLAESGPVPTAAGPLARLFPSAAALAGADPETLPMPRARGRAIVEMAAALADERVSLSTTSDPAQVRPALLACRGVGPWTADYVAMRALHDPDILLASDLVIKRELLRREITDTSDWSPWRSYATMHLWRSWTG
jgi:AraC family transcriptional regulator of adaptative response / DNA-3-methyladenine glycosylase II